MKKTLLRIICICLSVIPMSSASNASNIRKLYVADVMVARWGDAFITFTPGPRENIPECGAGYPNRYAIDASTPAGQSQLSNILTAFSAGLPVSIDGSGNCDVYPNTESAVYIWVYKQ